MSEFFLYTLMPRFRFMYLFVFLNLPSTVCLKNIVFFCNELPINTLKDVFEKPVMLIAVSFNSKRRKKAAHECQIQA